MPEQKKVLCRNLTLVTTGAKIQGYRIYSLARTYTDVALPLPSIIVGVHASPPRLLSPVTLRMQYTKWGHSFLHASKCVCTLVSSIGCRAVGSIMHTSFFARSNA